MTDLAQHIQSVPLMDTHEHLRKEHDYVHDGPDVLQHLFGNYVTADLVVAGASPAAMKRLTDASDPDLSGRFEGVRDAWEACRHTGYGEATRLIAREVYGMEEITPEGLEAAQARNGELRQPGERLRILREVANLDHVQTDDFCWECAPDASGPDFFLYDLSWRSFSNGEIETEALERETGVTVTGLPSLRAAMSGLHDQYAACAIAVKSQHAYNRTLRWHERSDADAERALHACLTQGKDAAAEDRLCLGDWCWARGVELAIESNLPFKIHTGYYAGHSRMPVSRIAAGNMCELFSRYPDARFVLMHIAYPYTDELVALAKHYPNVWVDLCWAWSINPYSSVDFVRQFIHAVPANKLFAFGGDTAWPGATLAYSLQARQWLTRALQGEVDDGLMTETEAMAYAERIMRRNQEACFDLAATRAAINAAGLAAAAD